MTTQIEVTDEEHAMIIDALVELAASTDQGYYEYSIDKIAALEEKLNEQADE